MPAQGTERSGGDRCQQHTVSAFEPLSEQPDRWFSKHGVQTAVAVYLRQSGWQLRWVGDCVARDQLHQLALEPVYDMEAERDGVRLLVEAIGHPGSLNGRDGRTLRAGLSTQGRTSAFPRYSDALFSAQAICERYPNARVVQAFPAWGWYRTDVPRTYGLPVVRQTGVELWMVYEDGTVKERAQAES
jgi:hypothetical protein